MTATETLFGRSAGAAKSRARDGDRSAAQAVGSRPCCAAHAGARSHVIPRDRTGAGSSRHDRESQSPSRAPQADAGPRKFFGGALMKLEREVIIDLLPAYFSGEEIGRAS